MYVLMKNGLYRAKVGYKLALTNNLRFAEMFHTVEGAMADKCGDETVRSTHEEVESYN